MGQRRLRNRVVSYEATGGKGGYSGHDLRSDICDKCCLTQLPARLENADKDYVKFLKLFYNYDISPQPNTNEHENDGNPDEVVEIEDEDEDEADPDYKVFLANVCPDKKSYVVKVLKEDGFPVLIKYEKDNGRKKQNNIEIQKDVVDKTNRANSCSNDEVQIQRFEPSHHFSQKKHKIMNRKLSSDASRMQHNCETKKKSGEEHMTGIGSIPANVSGKEERCNVDGDYMLHLDNLLRGDQSMKASLRSGYSHEYKAAEDDLANLYKKYDMHKKIESFIIATSPAKCHRSCKKQEDIEMQKDTLDEANRPNICSKDETEIQKFKPFHPVSPKKHGITNQKLSMRKSGASKRLDYCETKKNSGEEHMMGKGSRPVNAKDKEEPCDWDEDYHGTFQKQKNVEMQKDFMDETDMLNISNSGEVEIQRFEPFNPASQKKQRVMNRKLSLRKRGAYKWQGNREAKNKSDEKHTTKNGSRPVKLTCKEETCDVGGDYMLHLDNSFLRKDQSMKASLRGSYSYEATEDDLEILYNDSYPPKKIESFNLAKSSAKYEGRVGRRSKFRQKVMDLLKKPYDPNEYEELWTDVSDRKPIVRNIELRNGEVKFYETQKIGKSYLDHYKDLNRKLKEADDDREKKLKILRGFFFWLENLTQEEAFTPWNDAEFLALVAESSCK